MCEFCDEYKRLKIMETSIYQIGSIEQRKIKAGLVLSVINMFDNFESTQEHLKGTFELNFCPVCGRDLRKERPYV